MGDEEGGNATPRRQRCSCRLRQITQRACEALPGVPGPEHIREGTIRADASDRSRTPVGTPILPHRGNAIVGSAGCLRCAHPWRHHVDSRSGRPSLRVLETRHDGRGTGSRDCRCRSRGARRARVLGHTSGAQASRSRRRLRVRCGSGCWLHGRIRARSTGHRTGRSNDPGPVGPRDFRDRGRLLRTSTGPQRATQCTGRLTSATAHVGE